MRAADTVDRIQVFYSDEGLYILIPKMGMDTGKPLGDGPWLVDLAPTSAKELPIDT